MRASIHLTGLPPLLARQQRRNVGAAESTLAAETATVRLAHHANLV